MKRLLAIVGCLVLLTVSAGCTSMTGMDFGGGEKEKKNVQFNWDTDADATLTLNADQYQSVYKVNQRQLDVYTHDSLGQERALDLSSVTYRYPNESEITPSEKKSFYIDKSSKRTTIHVPKPDGKVAFVADKQSRSITMPVFLGSGDLDGPSYEVILPSGMDVSMPLLGSVQPNNYKTESVDGRVHVTWRSVESDSLSVRYYLNQDLFIFGGIAGILAVGGLIGAGYYLMQIRKLERIRKNIGFDIDTQDEQP